MKENNSKVFIEKIKKEDAKMTREELKTVIKCMSYWKIDKRKGNYRLPNGSYLNQYLEELLDKFLTKMGLAIADNGNCYDIVGKYILIPYGENELYDWSDDQNEKEIKLIQELL